MSVLKKLAGETALYGISTIVGRSLNFLLVGIHTKVFLPEELSVNTELYGWLSIAAVLYTYGMETTFFRFASKENKMEYYNLILSALILTSIILSIILISFSTPIMNMLGYPDQEIFMTWLVMALAIDSVMAIPFARLRLEKKPLQFVKARMINIFINIFFNVFFLIFCKDIYEGKYLTFLKPLISHIYFPEIGAGYIILANLIANIFLIPLLWKLFSDFHFRFDFTVFKKLWEYGYPIMIMGLASTINGRTDILLLKHILPDNFYPNRTAEQALGIYGNCYKLSIFMLVAINAFKFAAEPFFFSKAEDRNSPKIFSNVMKWFIIVCVFLWLLVSLNLDFLDAFLLNKDIYSEGIGVVPVLLLANLFLGIYYNLSVWFKTTDRTYFGTLITFLGAGLTIILNLLLIPVLGYMGCAYTFLISCFAMMAVCYLLGQKFAPMPYDTISAFGYIASAGLLIYFNSQIHISNLFVSIVYHLTILTLYILGIVLVERKTVIPLKIREKYAFLR
ncbi:Membrane protein involved in the export of O-antigen and teichoic acid [Pseudarcicella hirudinis]|uniref:Membrane protein involved in the export of O-antigen and teichoic acid n=2 Tax=Pseudarcicella hirudinis TaxID=1079859 RepID=A0A1I5VZI2_9BACT|nr:polysaccharide biosynthesis C-terminal domain-containing protein [Pseudarcicella hirudinis]SFQ12889.1 Membrane protein involved in the export of O-antigen and teichoic acid [Pseudarcicella hirudinis]